jgi:hypothetical protein
MVSAAVTVMVPPVILPARVAGTSRNEQTAAGQEKEESTFRKGASAIRRHHFRIAQV